MKISLKKSIYTAFGSMILAFGICFIHSKSLVTEGGVLGLTLLLQYLLGISPAISGFVLNTLFFYVGIKELGRNFLIYSVIAALSFSVFYKIFELFPPVFAGIENYPLEAAVLGAIFVGVGVGISVRAGGASGGDDAIAMALSHKWGISIAWIYLVLDVAVLLSSLCYIPVRRILFSLLTVFLSGQIVAFVQNFGKNEKKKNNIVEKNGN